MTPKERKFEQFKLATQRLAEAQREFEIAKALLTFDFDQYDPSKYEYSTTHDVIADELDVTTGTVIDWIKAGKLAGHKPEGKKKYVVKVADYERFKQKRGG